MRHAFLGLWAGLSLSGGGGSIAVDNDPDAKEGGQEDPADDDDPDAEEGEQGGP